MCITGIKPTQVLKDKFPVVYLLHGYGSNHAQYTGYTNAEMYGEERNIALVCFSTENKSCSKAGGDEFFTFLHRKLPEFITNYFPVSDKPEDTYLAGLSMGGCGTMLHGFSFPQMYHASGIFSGPAATNAETFARIPTGEPVELEQKADPDSDPLTIASKIKEEGKTFPRIYMACGMPSENWAQM